MRMNAKRLLVRGLVQGVFYRNWTVKQARELGILGWVRNLRSGAVEILAIGEDVDVAELIQRCRQGPPAARISEIVVIDAVAEPLETFEKRPTG
jgi:acylphosphatase